jgi:Holliday junction resolvase RusA-like endonuclease
VIFRFTIPGRLPGMNEIINACRHNRYTGAAQKKAVTNECGWRILERKVPEFRRPVVVRIRFIEPDRRRDVDNIQSGTKFIMDALVMARVLPNDTREWLKGISHTFPPPDKSNPRIEVTVEEIA